VVGESTPIRQLINQGAQVNQIEAGIAILISKYAKMLSVGGNLKEGQSVEIAKMLVEEYPLMSLDDFNIMLSRGVRGRYGEIFRFDVAVIFGWAGEYQAEWAEENERQWSKKKGDLKTAIEEIPQSDKVDELLNAFLKQLKEQSDGMKSVPRLTPQEIRKEGQAEAPRPKAHAYITDPEKIVMHQKKMQWARECTESVGGDGWQLKEGCFSFDEWLRLEA
jgi:hypothetical protein